MYDSTDPLFEDNPSHLARDFKNNPEGLKDHFEEKERSINALEQDIPEEELDSWREQRLELLENNATIREEAFARLEPGFVSDSDSDSDMESDSDWGPYSQSESGGSDSAQPRVTGNQADGNFPQDSSEVVQTDFSSFDPFDE